MESFRKTPSGLNPCYPLQIFLLINNNNNNNNNSNNKFHGNDKKKNTAVKTVSVEEGNEFQWVKKLTSKFETKV